MKGSQFFKKIDKFIGVPLVFTLGTLSALFDRLTRPALKPLSPGDRVLVVKLSALGDTLILLPVFKALKKQVGEQGKILMVATGINQPALKGFSYMDEVLLLDFGYFFRHPFAFLRFIGKLRAFKPTIALDFDQWLRVSPLICFLSGAARRYGFKTAGQHRHFLYQQDVPNGKGRHEIEQFADVAGLVGVDRSLIENYNGFLERENLFGDPPKTGSGEKKIVHIHPGCGSYGWQRAWPEAYYARLIQDLTKTIPVHIRLTGMGGYEEALVKKIIEASGVEVEDRSGRLEIEQLSTLLREADLVVCGNTGIMHLASGLGRPMVVMNGPADPVKWGPVPFPADRSGEKEKVRLLLADIHCSPCTTLGFEYGCPLRPCMESIPEKTVLRECLALLKSE